ncbi:uncharacterized protein BKCO1_1800018 [Diplodia corticola]|uniref:Uncharacterized protein n=1 Tax=Diplodia corticola TaxID=236234 RepID=A0A1J9R3T5_9PEZI|nr:uncharacterized protein BKCO1_1800018 [Diplodia corticola]OJD35272.1 hypothetical protein BKCO1_1800018 [Diplodia corticola]
MRLLHPFTGLLALADALGIEPERNNQPSTISPDRSRNTPYGTPPAISPLYPLTPSATHSASSTQSLLPTPSPSSSPNTTTACTHPSATNTNLLTNGAFALADGAGWTITGNFSFLPGKWPSYGIDSVPSTSSSSFDANNDDGDDGTANAFYANVRAPERRQVTLAQDFESNGGGGAGGGSKLYFGIELRASREEPPARVGCEYYYDSGGGEEVVEELVERQVPVPVERGAWARWGTVFDDGGGGGGGGEGRRGVRCRIVVEEGDFDGNEDVTVFVKSVVVAGCD